MIKIRQIHEGETTEDRLALASVLKIYREAFSYYPEYAGKISGFLEHPQHHSFKILLLVCESDRGRVLGFSLSFWFPKLHSAYLDYIATAPNRKGRGLGEALYEATRDSLKERDCHGLYMDVPPDDPKLLKELDLLPINKRRLAFYEKLGAFPLLGTEYEKVAHRANQGYRTFLVYDPLTGEGVPKARAVKGIIKRVLKLKGGMEPSHPKAAKILDSVVSGSMFFRAPQYENLKSTKGLQTNSGKEIIFVTTGDAHQIHHLREKGYVERPARIPAVQAGLASLPLKHVPIKKFPDRWILEVHHRDLFNFLKKAGEELRPKQLLYPTVFPLRRTRPPPRTWEMQAGYYCLDTFTPVTQTVYKAARQAADAALTGAEMLQKGGRLSYVLTRPPGHHAESRVFGGFCYFNQSAVAANYLSKSGKVCLLDIDYHHGNGSQEIFYQRFDVLFVSVHGHPKVAYPYFCGYPEEKGEGNGLGYNFNFPLYPFAGPEKYLNTLDKATKAIRKFKPDYLVVSLGLDIMKGDPTGDFNLSPKDMREVGVRLKDLDLPTLVVQEGGYSLKNLRTGIQQFLLGMSVSPK